MECVRGQPLSNPTVDDLVTASLTPGGERVLLPVDHIDWRVLQEFASRRRHARGGGRRAPVDRRGNPRAVPGAAAAAGRDRPNDRSPRERRRCCSRCPDFSAPITITADDDDLPRAGGINIEERNISVNGAAIAGGGAQSPPELPLIEPERIGTPPLVITLNEAYRYALDGEDSD